MTDMTAAQTPTVVDDVNVDELITAEALTEYRERGYWVSPKLFSAEQIAKMREAQERMWRGEHDSEIPSQYGASARWSRVRRTCASSATRSGSAT